MTEQIGDLGEGLISGRLPATLLSPILLLVWWEREHGESPSTDQIAAHFARSRRQVQRWMGDLQRLGLVEQVRAGREIRYRATGDTTVALRRRADGRPARCAVCSALNPRGRWCERCKQTHGRHDRAWWPLCERYLRQGMTPYSVQAQLRRDGHEVPLWDHVPSGQELQAPGIVSRGLMSGLLDEDWADRQKEALGGGDDEW